nr:hypothetical protein [Enterobacter roggenkampii]
MLPLDGFVFWVKASVLSDDPSSEPDTVDVKGYLHLTTETIQDDEQLYDRNVVTFTAQADIDRSTISDLMSCISANFLASSFPSPVAPG